MTCQSVMQPSTAEYWHIGAMTIRLVNSRVPTRNGVNSVLIADFSLSWIAVESTSNEAIARSFSSTGCGCPLMAQGGHCSRTQRCPLHRSEISKCPLLTQSGHG